MNKNFISSTVIEIRYMDTDHYGHVNNSKYYDYMSESRAHAFLEVADCGFVITENSCKYIKPLHYKDTLILDQYVNNISICTFELHYTFKNKSNVCVAEGLSKIVCFDLVKKRPIKVSDKLKEFLNSNHMNT